MPINLEFQWVGCKEALCCEVNQLLWIPIQQWRNVYIVSVVMNNNTPVRRNITDVVLFQVKNLQLTGVECCCVDTGDQIIMPRNLGIFQRRKRPVVCPPPQCAPNKLSGTQALNQPSSNQELSSLSRMEVFCPRKLLQHSRAWKTRNGIPTVPHCHFLL